MQELLLLAVGAGMALLVWRWRADQQALKARRSHFLDLVLPLLDSGLITQDGADYPSLSGVWRGVQVEIRPIADSIAVRKLPALWLSVSLVAPTGQDVTLDALQRASGVEYWSPSADLPRTLPVPAGWPETVRLAADGEPGQMLARVAEAGSTFFADARAKELLVTPKGVRLVVMLDEGARGPYLLLRQAEFALDRLPADVVEALLLRAQDLLHRLQEP
ncbi:MAG: hypothetical protein U1E45_14670 [Geminicoccaceae bacterium]